MLRLMSILSCLVLFSLFSCSVKEARENCPCLLSVDVSQYADDGKSVNVEAWGESVLFERSEVMAGQVPIRAEVSRGMVHTAVHTGISTGLREGNLLMIPLGCEADRLWAFAECVDCRGEEASVRVGLHKQYAEVKLCFVTRDGENFTHELDLEGDTSGLDMLLLEPVEGRFQVRLKPDRAGYCTFMLPRQKHDEKLTMSLISESGEIVDVLPLGEWIRSIDYDWTAPDLEDMTLYIDYAKSIVSIQLDAWEEGRTMIIEI